MLNRIKDLFKGEIGFQIEEVMKGEHVFEPGQGPEGSHPFEFRVVWGPDRLAGYLDPKSAGFLTQPMEGVVTVGGMCRDTPCRGTLELRYFDERKIRYTFDFHHAGVRYRFVGEKVNIRPWNLPVSHTTCFGVLTESEGGRLVSRSVTHFRMETIPGFLLSFRLK